MMLGGQPPVAGGPGGPRRMIAEPVPPWLRTVLGAVESFVRKDPAPAPAVARVCEGGLNHALVNEYGPDDGIEAHEDGPVYDGFAAILSLDEVAVLNFEPRRGTDHRPFAIVLEPNSLIIFCGVAYDGYTHGIEGGTRTQTGIDTAANVDRIDAARLVGAGPGGGAVPPPRSVERTGRRLSLTLRRVRGEFISKGASALASRIMRPR